MNFLDISLELANEFYKWGWRASAWGAGITLLGVIFLMWGTRVRDRDTEEKMVLAHERSAKLEKEAAIARLETELLKKQVAWREVTPQQSGTIQNELRKTPMQITVSWVAGDPEGSAFAHSIAISLQNSGSELLVLTPMGFSGEEPHGLYVSGSEKREVELLASALRKAGLGPIDLKISNRKQNGSKSFTHLQIGYRSPPSIDGKRQPVE